MKKFFTLLGLSMLTSAGFSQATIANMGFENWSDIVVLDSLEEWRTSTQQNQYSGVPVDNSYQITSAQAGTYAMHLETMLWYNSGSMQNDTLFAYILKEDAGTGFTGFPYTDTVDTFTGWYKSDVMPGDTAYALVELSNAGTVYASAVYKFFGTQNSWTQFSLPIIGGETEVPDSVFVAFSSSDPFVQGVPVPGSWLEIDDISFEFNLGGVTPSVIPNQSFENLVSTTIEQPDNWFTFDPLMFLTVNNLYTTKSTDAAVGSFSMQLETTLENFMNGIPSIATNGNFDMGSGNFVGGVTFTAQPDSIKFQFKYAPTLTDTGFVLLDMWNATSGSLVSLYDTLFNTTVWTTRSIDLGLTEAPDSLRLTFYSGANVGSILMIDDIQFVGGDVSVEHNTANPEWSYYPNPSSDIVTISFVEATEIEIIDITGKTIYFNNNLNSNSLSISTIDWNNGIYFIRMNVNGNMETKKLVIRH